MTPLPNYSSSSSAKSLVSADLSSSSARPDAWASARSFGLRREQSPVFPPTSPSLGRPPSSTSTHNPWSSSASSITQVRQNAGSPLKPSSLSSIGSPPGLQSQAGSASKLGIDVFNASTAGAGSSVGGASKNYRASPSRQSASPTPSHPGNTGANQSGSLSKIVIAQVFLLLSSIKDDKDRTKWEAEAEKIQKVCQSLMVLIQLVDSHGMEVFTKYFRRLLVNNAAQIWGSQRAEPSGNYPILLGEVQKVNQDPSQARKIVESIEGGDGDLFKDFDLSVFMEHFKLDAIQKVTLASAFRTSVKPDMRTKADAILTNNIQSFIHSLASPTEDYDTNENEIFSSIIDSLARNPPRNWTAELRENLQGAVELRYHKLSAPVPNEISSSMFLFELTGRRLVKHIQKQGPRMPDSTAAALALIESADPADINAKEVASALLFMSVTTDETAYPAENFVRALQTSSVGRQIDWQGVILAFDQNGLRVTKTQFAHLFNALLPVARQNDTVELERLWSGDWRHESTELSFLTAFLSCTDENLSILDVPRLKQAYSLEDVADMSDSIKAYAKTAINSPFVSLEAVKTIFRLGFSDPESYESFKSLGHVDRIVNANIPLFVAAGSALGRPWPGMTELALKMLTVKILERATGESPEHNFTMSLLWKREPDWTLERLKDFHSKSPMTTNVILDMALEGKWFHSILSSRTVLSIELATAAHGRGLFDLETWLVELVELMTREVVLPAIRNFLEQKIEDDVAFQKAGEPHQSIPLTVKTANALLTFLGDQQLPEMDRVHLQRLSISAYPRLINYGHDEELDRIIENNGVQGNALSPEADEKMQEHFRRMWNGEQKVQDIVHFLQQYKVSRNPTDQDLFACMIYGLFDEYNCFAQYPMNALADTAVLFGGIINFQLLSKVALQVAISMVLEAVRENQPTDLMFKFGLQALIQFRERLESWELLSAALLDIPTLKDTEIYPTLERLARERQDAQEADAENGRPGPSADDFLANDGSSSEYTCLNVDLLPIGSSIAEPDEAMEEQVLFLLNNVSEVNLKQKTTELIKKVTQDYFRWFSAYLVEGRVKSQPNYHKLFEDMLNLFQSTELWNHVVRETIACAARLLNVDTSKSSPLDRKNLQNIGSWLGMITLARDVPIRHRNIPFKELLLEASNTDRLPTAISFTCKVLTACIKSAVFKPPCSWTMELVSVLMEIYHFVDVKIVVKFEIEVLCNALELDYNEIEPSEFIRRSPAVTDEPELDDEDVFGDHLAGLNRSRPLERLSPAAVLPHIAELSSILKHNYTLSNADPRLQEQVKQSLTSAVESAVSEIIGAVVERSVTIGAIATSQLVQKDFALERDVGKLRSSAHIAAQSLSGSLAAVTCKEPLRNTMQANIQALRSEIPEQVLPQGIILMFVNDNLDNVCNIVEKAAATASVSDIDLQLEEAIHQRQDVNFGRTPVNEWSNFIAEPYKLSSNGLTAEQLSIYVDFSRLSRAPPHGVFENGRAINDNLNDQFQPSFAQADGDRFNHIQHGQQPAGLNDGPLDEEHATELIDSLWSAIAESTEQHVTLGDSGAVLQARHRLRQAILGQAGVHQDAASVLLARQLFFILYVRRHPAGVLAYLADALKEICTLSDVAEEKVFDWFHNQPENRQFDARVATALVKHRVIPIDKIDALTSVALEARSETALRFLDEIVDGLLLPESPTILRADLSLTFTSLSKLISQGFFVAKAERIVQKLSLGAALGDSHGQEGLHEDQLAYIIEEWTQLIINQSPPAILALFAQQLQSKRLLSDPATLAAFLRVGILASIQAQTQDGILINATEQNLRPDALASLIAHLVKLQGNSGGIVTGPKHIQLRKILTLIVLIFAQQSQHPLGLVNQKVFFRLFSTLLYKLREVGFNDPGSGENDSTLAVARCLPMLRPQHFPGFAFAWLSLISHRLILPRLMQDLGAVGRQVYCDLLCHLLNYVGQLLQPAEVDAAARDFYRGTLKTLLVIHHDFSDFLAEHAFLLLPSVPPFCTQLRSLIISASPSSSLEMPDPFADGLKVDMLTESKQSPVIAGDFHGLLVASGLDPYVNKFVTNAANGTDEDLDQIIHIVCNTPSAEPMALAAAANVELLHALLIRIVQAAEGNTARGLVFVPTSPAVKLLERLTARFEPEPRYLWLSAIANNLRYPNTHTIFFCHVMFQLFRPGSVEPLALDIQQQITRVLMERIIVHRPHPWGLIVTLVELLKNRTYHMFDLPFVRAEPSIENMLHSLLSQMSHGARPVG